MLTYKPRNPDTFKEGAEIKIIPTRPFILSSRLIETTTNKLIQIFK